MSAIISQVSQQSPVQSFSNKLLRGTRPNLQPDLPANLRTGKCYSLDLPWLQRGKSYVRSRFLWFIQCPLTYNMLGLFIWLVVCLKQPTPLRLGRMSCTTQQGNYLFLRNLHSLVLTEQRSEFN